MNQNEIMATIEASLLSIIGFSLISSALILLLSAIIFIKKKRYKAHKYTMLGAIILSTSFLLSYIIKWTTEGETQFKGPDTVRIYFYYPLLIVHIMFAIFSIFLVGRQFFGTYKTVKHRLDGTPYFDKESRLTHRTNGKKGAVIWGISFTGGIITFFMLYILYR